MTRSWWSSIIKGQEVQVGILDDRPIGAIEIVPKNEFYDFEAKYTDGMAEHIFPARLEPALYEKAQQIGLAAHRALGCTGYSRVDLLVTPAGDCYVLEVNTLPGMTALSLLPEIAQRVPDCRLRPLCHESLNQQHSR